MNRVAIDLGFIQIYWYSLFIFFGILVGGITIVLETKKHNLKEDTLVDITFYSLILGIIGARLYYVLFNLDYYSQNIIEIFKIWNGGLAIHGGLLFAFLFIYYYCKKHKINIYKFLDIVVIGLIIGQAIGRWGNFFNNEAYGSITTLNHLKQMHIPKFIIDGMYISGNYRKPTFLYESIFCFIGFIIMLLIRKYNKLLQNGELTSFYLVWYGMERFFIEKLRSDSLMLGPIKMAQLVSIIFIILGILTYIKVKNQKNNLYKDDNLFIKNTKNRRKKYV